MPRARPPGAGHGKRDPRQAAIGGAVPGKALVQDHDALGLAVPLPHQDGPELEAMTVLAPCREFGQGRRMAIGSGERHSI